jgi:regulatory protein
MKITYCPKGELREEFLILLDEEPRKEVHLAIFGRRPKWPKTIASWSDWQEQFNRLEYQAVKNYVLRRLTSQSYHSYQLKKLLKERLVQPATIQRVIEECLNSGYLNDEAWIESFMRGRLKRSSLRSILPKLQARGLPASLIEEIAERWQDPEQEMEAVGTLLRTKYRSKDLTQPKERQKVIASLLRKGYSYAILKQALKIIESEE